MAEKKNWKNCNRFSEKLSQRMLQLGLNGQKLARKSEVSDSEISRIMNGKSLPGLENAIALSKAVDVSLDYLADDALDLSQDRPKDTVNEMDTMVLKLIRDIGSFQALNLMENARIIGYEVAIKRMLDAKPAISPQVESGGSGRSEKSSSGRASSAG